MGQAASSNQPKTEYQFDPDNVIDTVEKFQSGFIRQFQDDFPHEVDQAEEVFGYKRQCDSPEVQLPWDKHVLGNILSYAVPTRLKADIRVASPLLLKAMIRLGAFPFHNLPTHMHSTLSTDDAAVAILFFVRKHEEFYRDWDDDDKVHCDKYFHRLMFQVMSDKQCHDELSTRDTADDEDLILVRDVLQANNYERDEKNFKVGHWLPPVIEVSKLPCSRSRDLTGSVPREELRALLEVLYGISRYISVNTSADINQLIETHGTDWLGFETVVTKLEPHFSSGFRQLFDMFVNFWKWELRLDDAGFFEDQSLGRPNTD